MKGIPVSRGLGIAHAFHMESVDFVSTYRIDPNTSPTAELNRLEAGVHEVEYALSQIPSSLAQEAMKTMLKDPLFHGSIVDRIQAGKTAEDAVVETTHDLLAIFGELPDPALRVRGDYAEDIGQYLFRSLQGQPIPLFCQTSPVVLITEEMNAFDAARLSPDSVKGIVCEKGGENSHFAIIAKQVGIPVVMDIKDVVSKIQHGTYCICDGSTGLVITEPDEDTLTEYQALLESGDTPELESDARQLSTQTKDGKKVELWGNIAGIQDARAVTAAGGSGVGLFRTEFIFMGDEAPSEERQAYIYSEILQEIPGPVVMRTLEAGGDKIIPYLAGEEEENPNLGWQGLRMCLDMPELFLTQLRAMLRASVNGELWIMFPFVSALWELRMCKQLVAQADQELRRMGITPGPYKVGVMIEIPSAALMAKEFIRGFDFCAMGTNDLTQFTLAADRMNPKVSRWYDPLHPAVLRLLALCAQEAQKAHIPIGIAGDMAANPMVIPFLLGVGFHSLSVTPPSIPRVRKDILSIHSREAKAVAQKVLTMTESERIQEYLQQCLAQLL